MTGDKSWDASKMKKYFMKIENNLYLPNGTAGHGFGAYLNTMTMDASWAAAQSDSADIVLQLAIETGQNTTDITSLVNRDINALDPHRDQSLGWFNLVSHATKDVKRSGPNSYIKSTLSDPKKYPLTVKVNSLATRILFSTSNSTMNPI